MTALLIVSGGLNLFLVVLVRQANQMTREAHASVEGLLDRINTSERVQVEGKLELPALQDERPWISDYEYDQHRWDEHVGATEEVD